MAGLSTPTDARSAEPAHPITFKARIGVFYAGFLVYSGDLAGRLDRGRYKLAYAAQTRGLLRLVSSVDTKNEVVGMLRGGRFRAVTYRDRVRWRGKRTTVEVSFGPAGAVRTVANPSFTSRNRRPIPVAVSRGASDPLTTLIAGMVTKGNARPCTWKHRVYDGRRLLRLEFENLGVERLRGDGLTMYRGPAVKCRVRFVELANTRRKSQSRKKKRARGDRDEAVFWLARFRRPAIWLPVRARGWSRVGAVHAGITFLKINGADAAQSR
jgi:hypothetical protein